MKGLLLSVIITGLLIVAASIIVGIRSFDGTVTDNAYEEGLRWDDTNKMIKELGIIVKFRNKKIRVGENDVFISINRSDGTPYNPSSLRLHITRPSTDRYDIDVTAERIGDGLYRARMNLPLYGYWQVIIIPAGLEGGVEFKEEIFVEKGG